MLFISGHHRGKERQSNVTKLNIQKLQRAFLLFGYLFFLDGSSGGNAGLALSEQGKRQNRGPLVAMK